MDIIRNETMPSLRNLAMCLASPCGMVGIDELLISKKNDQNPKRKK